MKAALLSALIQFCKQITSGGCFVNFQRMYLYAVLNLIGFALIGRITSAGVVFTMLGLIILVIGIIVLRNFIKHHPKVSLQDETG